MAVSATRGMADRNHREIASQHFCKSASAVAICAGILQDGRMDADFKLDTVDLRILRVLQANGRATYDEVAAEVSLSPSATLRRVKRLEDAGVIAGYVALVQARGGRALAHRLHHGAAGEALRDAQAQAHGRVPRVGADLARRRRVQLAHRRDGLPAARAGERHGALLALRDGHAAQAPQRAGLQDQLRARSREADDGGAAAGPGAADRQRLAGAALETCSPSMLRPTSSCTAFASPPPVHSGVPPARLQRRPGSDTVAFQVSSGPSTCHVAS